MLVKASQVSNLTDARYFAAKEVDYLGFNLEEGTEGYLDPMYMKAIREWVTGPKIAGEFATMPAAHVAEAARFLGLDAVQISAEKHLPDIAALEGLELILQVDGNLDFEQIQALFVAGAPSVACFLLDFSRTTDWLPRLRAGLDEWNKLLGLRPTFLHANIGVEQLTNLFETLQFAGLSLAGGEEERVGVKSFDQLEDIFEALGR